MPLCKLYALRGFFCQTIYARFEIFLHTVDAGPNNTQDDQRHWRLENMCQPFHLKEISR